MMSQTILRMILKKVIEMLERGNSKSFDLYFFDLTILLIISKYSDPFIILFCSLFGIRLSKLII